MAPVFEVGTFTELQWTHSCSMQLLHKLTHDIETEDAHIYHMLNYAPIKGISQKIAESYQLLQKYI